MNRFQAPSHSSSHESVENDFKYPAYLPPVPREFDELKVSHSLLTDLMLRHLRTYGVSSFRSLAGMMKLSSSIVQVLFEHLRNQHLVEVKGTTGLDYSFGLTEAGRHFAAERSEMSSYTGPAPVSLEQYTRAVR